MLLESSLAQTNQGSCVTLKLLQTSGHTEMVFNCQNPRMNTYYKFSNILHTSSMDLLQLKTQRYKLDATVNDHYIIRLLRSVPNVKDSLHCEVRLSS